MKFYCTNLLLHKLCKKHTAGWGKRKDLKFYEENWTTEVAFGGKNYKRARPSVGKSNSLNSVALTQKRKTTTQAFTLSKYTEWKTW